MNTETVTVHQKGENFEITVQHDQSGSAYGMPLSKNAYEQLRQHFVSGSFSQKDMENFAAKCMLFGHQGKTTSQLLKDFCDNDR